MSVNLVSVLILVECGEEVLFWSFVADRHRLTNENRRRRRSCEIQVELTKTISLL